MKGQKEESYEIWQVDGIKQIIGFWSRGLNFSLNQVDFIGWGLTWMNAYF